MASMVAASPTPALLKIRLTRPWSVTTWSAKAYTASRSATSTRCDVIFAAAPAPSQSMTVSARPGSLMSDRARWAPRTASSRASARPMPEPAPVTAATRPRNVFMPDHLPGGRGLGLLADGVGEHHGTVLDAAHLQGPVVAQVALVDLPREPRALLREAIGRALDVDRGEVEQRPGSDRRAPVDRRGLAHAGRAQVVDETADVTAGEVALERPRCVRVADGDREVRHALDHHPLVGQPGSEVDGLAVDRKLDPAEEQQLDAGRGDDDVGLELGARPQPHPLLGERVDVVGDQRRGAVPDGLEEVAIGREAEPLVPGVVPGSEVGVDVVSGRQLALENPAKHLLDELGPAAARR